MFVPVDLGLSILGANPFLPTTTTEIATAKGCVPRRLADFVSVQGWSRTTLDVGLLLATFAQSCQPHTKPIGSPEDCREALEMFPEHPTQSMSQARFLVSG